MSRVVSTLNEAAAAKARPEPRAWARLQDNRTALGVLFLLPAAVLLLLFLTYPLALGTYLGFTDTKIGRGGEWIGFQNLEVLLGGAGARLALFNTLFFTGVPSALQFVPRPWAWRVPHP